jgi:hypothetical protein
MKSSQSIRELVTNHAKNMGKESWRSVMLEKGQCRVAYDDRIEWASKHAQDNVFCDLEFAFVFCHLVNVGRLRIYDCNRDDSV